MTGFDLTDMETCYKVFKADLIREIAKDLEAKDLDLNLKLQQD